jgi:excisionase family DNA binding protein
VAKTKADVGNSCVGLFRIPGCMNLEREFRRFLEITGDATAAAVLAAAACAESCDDLLSVADVAAMLGVSDDKVRALIRRGSLRAYDLNQGSTRSHLVIKRSAVYDLLETVAVPPPRHVARRGNNLDAGDWV